MQTVELRDAQTRLIELVESLTPGDEIVIEANHKPVARLLSADRSPKALREFAGKFRPLPQAEQDDLKMHDRVWCDPKNMKAVFVDTVKSQSNGLYVNAHR